jgi:hypothetical protein
VKAKVTPPRYGRRYPWVEWFRKRKFTLRLGRDYDCMPHCIAQMARNWANRDDRRLKLDIKIRPNGDVTVTVVGRMGERRPRT